MIHTVQSFHRLRDDIDHQGLVPSPHNHREFWLAVHGIKDILGGHRLVGVYLQDDVSRLQAGSEETQERGEGSVCRPGQPFPLGGAREAS